MKKRKKGMALCLAVCMAAGLTACGNGGKNGAEGTAEPSVQDTSAKQETNPADTTKTDTTKADTTETTAADPQKEGTASLYDKYPAADLGGRTVTIGVNWDYVPANTEYVFNADTDDPGILYTLENMKRIEEKYNCKLQYVNIPYDQRMEKITTSVMSQSPVADIMGLDIAQILPLAANDMLLAYEEIVPENNDVFGEQLLVAPQGTVFGKTYAIEVQGLPVTGDYLCVNLDIVNALGLAADPVELYEKGEWTWDAFMEIAKAATKDTDGDGKADQFGISGPPSTIANMLTASNGGSYFDENANVQTLDSPETMQAFEQFNLIYNVEKAALVAGTMADWDQNLYAFKEGKAAMSYMADWVMPDGDARPEYEYTVVPFPKGPANKTDSTFMKAMAGYVILKGVKDPQYIYQIYEELKIPEDEDLDERDQGTRDWLANKFRIEEDIERTFEICGTGAKYDAFTGIPGFPVGEILGAIYEDGKTPAQAVEEFKPVAQDKINAIMKK